MERPEKLRAFIRSSLRSSAVKSFQASKFYDKGDRESILKAVDLLKTASIDDQIAKDLQYPPPDNED